MATTPCKSAGPAACGYFRLNPQDASAFGGRGRTYWAMGRYDLALDDFGRAIELDAADASAIYGRGETYQAMGRYDLALADFDRAIELDPQGDHQPGLS